MFPAPLPHPDLRLVVVVPARNEANNLTQTLDSLRRQQIDGGLPFNPDEYEVLLLTNNCTDDSYALATQYQRRYPEFPLRIADICLPAPQAHIGTARRLLMDEACRRLTSLGQPQGVIASTDGDTVVDSRWIHTILQEMERGVDAVGGRILTRPDGSSVRLFHLRDVTFRWLAAQVEALLDPHPHDPFPRHFQHFGANMAVTCQMYQKAGRLPEVRFLEDEAFYRAMLRVDAKVRKSPDVKVYTSTRVRGRVEVGFSWILGQWTYMHQMKQVQTAEPAGAVIIRSRNRHRLRRCWETRYTHRHEKELLLIARELMVDYRWLCRELLASAYFGQCWENVLAEMEHGPWASRWKQVPIMQTIRLLRAFLRKHGAFGERM